MFVSYGSKCREKAVKWRAFQDYFAFYSEPVAQTSKLIVYSPPEDANPSVDDGLCSDTVTARAKSGTSFLQFTISPIVPAVAELRSTQR